MKANKKPLLRLVFLAIGIAVSAPPLAAQTTWREKWQQRREERREARAEKGLYGNFVAGIRKFHLRHQGRQRYYLVYVPKTYSGNVPTAVVLNFHGGGGSAEGHQRISAMNEKAESAGFIAVYPAGTRRDGDPDKMFGRLWNVGEGPNGPYYADSDPISRIDDVGFVRKLLNDLESKFNIDKKRVYATGLSNGGILTHLLACRLNHRIAAIAPVGAPYWTYPEECAKAKAAVSVILFHGTADVCAPYDGGVSQCSSREAIDRNFISAQETADIWLGHDGCAKVPVVTYHKGEVTCETYGSCDDGAEVTLCTVDGGGHTWPGGRPYSVPGLDIGKTTSDINANDAMWAFFKKHPKK